MFKDFKNYWQLTKALAYTDFKLRYHGSFLGYIWTLIKPLMLFAVLFIVFSLLMKSTIENYQIYLLLGIILWNFFAEGTSMGLNSLLSKKHLITKVYFPRIVVIIASTISSFITFLFNFIIFIIFLIISKVPFDFSMLFFAVYLAELYIIILGLSLILSTLNVRFRDMSHIWEILLQLGFWLTPIFYSINIVPFEFHRLFYVNLIARIITYSRIIFLDGYIPSLRLNLLLALASIFIFLMGLLCFKKLNKNIVEKL